MRFIFTLPVLAGLVSGQGVDFDAYQTAAPASADGPSSTAVIELPIEIYNATAVRSSVAAAVSTAPVDGSISSSKLRRGRRDTSCAAEPAGYGPPVQDPDTPEAFQSSIKLQAYSYAASAPSGYTESFANLNGSTQLSTYMGLYSLTSYDPSQCATYCNEVSGCLAFNLYFERDPTVNPGDDCPNPASQTDIKCTLYGSQINAASATNVGQYRDQFHVVIAGSNGYNKWDPPAALGGYTSPVAFDGAINITVEAGISIYVGARFFNQPYDAGVCAALCNATTFNNRATALARYTASEITGGSYDGSYQACNYFNAYILSASLLPQGLYCSLYTTVIPSDAPTFTSVQKGFVDYSVSYSYGFAASVQDNGTVAAA